MQTLRKFPIGIQSFEKLRNDGCFYVDKTEFVYKLASEGSSYFLSRPRRFGKSLLVSTMHAYFSGRRELFAGLKLAELERNWIPHPVLHFDFTGEDYSHAGALEGVLDKHLRRWEKLYQADASGTKNDSLSLRFAAVIESACEMTGRKVVILVDEYDKSLLETDGALQEQNRNLYKGFFSNLKGMDAYIKFAFITGVTKFGKVSIFSDLNQLEDISLSEDYAAICGITQTELEANFSSEIDALSARFEVSRAACVARLKQMYDGYRFHHKSEGLYNPFSLMHALKSKEFDAYWFSTGTPTFLIQRLENTGFDPKLFTSGTLTIDKIELLDYRPDNPNPLPLFFQAGYLTIQNFDSEIGAYTLGYPNNEVKYAFLKNLIPLMTKGAAGDSGALGIAAFKKDIETGMLDSVMERFKSLFARLPYATVGADKLDSVIEQNFQNVVYIVFSLLGQFVTVEEHYDFGRADCVVQTAEYVYIFEFKRDKTAGEALAQIEGKKYADAFAADPRTLFQVGVVFSTAERNIAEWKVRKREA